MSTPISAIRDFRDALLHTRDRQQDVALRRERADALLDLCRQPTDRLVEEVDEREHLSDDQRVLAVEASDERFAQGGDLLAQPAARELGEDFGVGRALHQGVEHVAPGLAHDVRRDRPELDPRVLERLVQPRDLATTIVDLPLR